jgi:hypothetical protein
MHRLLVVWFVCLLAHQPSAGSHPTKSTATLRDEVLKATDPHAKAKAYKALFVQVGRAGLKELTEDADTGLALQAAWEHHKKPAKRAAPKVGETDDIYDPHELANFVTFLRERTKAPVPDWWSESIQNTSLFPGRHHGFDPDPLQRGDSVTNVKTDKWSVFARAQIVGFRYELACYMPVGGAPAWVVDVWSAGRTCAGGGGFGCHRVELREKGGRIYVFGAESHGMYLEVFELATGKCLYRFCTCYWFNFSEAWGLR